MRNIIIFTHFHELRPFHDTQQYKCINGCIYTCSSYIYMYMYNLLFSLPPFPLTCLFQAMPLMSSRGWILLPGLMALPGLFRSQMKISLSLAPDASRLGWKGLKSNVRTGPVCWLFWCTWEASEPLGGEGRGGGDKTNLNGTGLALWLGSSSTCTHLQQVSSPDNLVSSPESQGPVV